MNKDIKYWDKEFNLIGLVSNFDKMHYQRFKTNYYGLLNLIIFDRKDIVEVKKVLPVEDLFLDGYVPKKPKDEFWDYDFLMTENRVVPFFMLRNFLTDVKDKIILIQFEVTKRKDGLTQIAIINSF